MMSSRLNQVYIWSGTRESNPCLRLGKAAYYHCTSTADFQTLPNRAKGI